jgi:hypothetical protein
MSSSDDSNSVNPDDGWPYVIPNYESLSADMQAFIKANMQSLVEAAQAWAAKNPPGGSSSANRTEHNLGMVTPGVTYDITGRDKWRSVGANYIHTVGGAVQENITLTNQRTIGGGLSSSQQSTMAAQYDMVDGQRVEEVLSNHWESIGGTYYSQIGSNLSGGSNAMVQAINGTRYETVNGNDVTWAKTSKSAFYGNSESVSLAKVVFSEISYGANAKIIQGHEFKQVKGTAYYTYGGQAIPLPPPVEALTGSTLEPLEVVIPPATSTTMPLQDPSYLTWTSVAEGFASWLPYAGTTYAGESLTPPPSVVKVEEAAGSVINSIFGLENKFVQSLSTTTNFGGTEDFTQGMRSESVLGTSKDVIVGSSMQTVVGSHMPMVLTSAGVTVMGSDQQLTQVTEHMVRTITSPFISFASGSADGDVDGEAEGEEESAEIGGFAGEDSGAGASKVSKGGENSGGAQSSSNREGKEAEQFDGAENQLDASNQGAAPGEATSSDDDGSSGSSSGGSNSSSSLLDQLKDAVKEKVEEKIDDLKDQAKDAIQAKAEDLVSGFLTDKLGWSDQSAELFIEGGSEVISQISGGVDK